MLPLQAIAYLENMPKDEPVFILRARDKYCPSAIAAWAGLVQAPLSKEKPSPEKSLAKATEAMRLVKQMRYWQEDNPDQVKIPD